MAVTNVDPSLRASHVPMGCCNESIVLGRGRASSVELRVANWSCVVVSASSATPRSLNCRPA